MTLEQHGEILKKLEEIFDILKVKEEKKLQLAIDLTQMMITHTRDYKE